MGPFEIILIIVCVLIVVGVFGSMIYKKVKGIPTCDCGCGGHKGNKLLKKYHKKYQKDGSSCCCGKCHEEVDKTKETSTCCCCNDKKDEQ